MSGFFCTLCHASIIKFNYELHSDYKLEKLFNDVILENIANTPEILSERTTASLAQSLNGSVPHSSGQSN